jgi:glycosyltransferase involved in cell wall biosynthesis
MIRALAPHLYGLRPDSVVGGEVYERELLRRLPAHGVELVLGLPRRHAASSPPPGWEVCTLRHSPRVRWPLTPVAFVPWLVARLRGGGVDLLRGHSIRGTGPSLLVARALAGVDVPIVLHQHHLEPRWTGLELAIMRRAELVVTVSERSRAALVDRGVPAELIAIVANGVAGPSATEPWSGAWPASGGLKLLHLGRLEPRKRPRLALDALTELRRRGVDASLVLAGDGPQRGELEDYAARLGLDGAVRFLGRVDDRAKWRLYDTADALVFCSALEGFGLVAVEAQSRGTPVVAASGTGAEEAIRDGESGSVVAPDPRAFAEALASLAADPARRSGMGDAARAHARRFSWDASAARAAALYAGLASSTGRTRSVSRARTAAGR